MSGAALILPSAQFDALATLEAVQRERATALYGVPTMFIAELEHPEFHRFDLSSLRTGVMAGAPCPIEVMKRVVEQMHCREITIAYGQTEASPVITMSRVDDPLELRVSTVGAALANTEVQIVDPKTRERAARRRAGRVVHARLPGDEGLRRRSRGHRAKPSTAKAGCTPATWP